MSDYEKEEYIEKEIHLKDYLRVLNKRRRVMAWCHAGAAGFFVTLAGCALMLLWIILY